MVCWSLWHQKWPVGVPIEVLGWHGSASWGSGLEWLAGFGVNDGKKNKND